MIANYFIQAIDKVIKAEEAKGNILSRQNVLEGIPLLDENGKKIKNQKGEVVYAVNTDIILSAVYNRIMEDYSLKWNDSKIPLEKKEYIQ